MVDATKVLEKCVAGMQKRPTLRLGASGKLAPFVHEWQVLMQREMRAQIRADGIFGADTRGATMAFQRKVGLPPDGVVAAKTWTAAAVAPCYALAAAKAAGPTAQNAAKGAAMQKMQGQRSTHGLGDFSFSVLDVKSVVLGAVLGIGAGFVLFRRK